VLHPTARWETKLWEGERWRSLAAALTAAGIGTVFTGSATDTPTIAGICAGLGPRSRSLAGRLSLKHLAAVLARADLVVTVDSGPMHVAAAVGTRVLALFGPTDPARTGPLGAGRVLRRSLPCAPCLRRHCQIADTRRCMRELGVDEVLATAAELLGRAMPASRASVWQGERRAS
jgi:ADP-heptose:LPS heptosyltransferase